MARQPPEADVAEADMARRAEVGAGTTGHDRSPIEVVAVFGPTASGKSALATAVADTLGTEVVSADAMQVYRGLPILTNQSTPPERLVGFRELDEEMSVGAFATLAHREIDGLVESFGTAVVAGGTGLYLRAALTDLDVPPRAPRETRARIETEVARDSGSAHARLVELDPAAAVVVHANDRQRLARALELAETGHSLARGGALWSPSTRRRTIVVGIDVPAAVLQRRIRERAGRMFRDGVVAEVQAALRQPVSRTAEKALGLREIATLPPDEALERIVVRTRRYAAYQRKWMHRVPNLVRLDGMRPLDELTAAVVALARR